MRKLLRSMAKAEMERRGYAKVNRLMSEGRWREVLGVYPGFLGAKRQRPGSRQPILTYPAPRGRYRGVAGGRRSYGDGVPSPAVHRDDPFLARPCG